MFYRTKLRELGKENLNKTEIKRIEKNLEKYEQKINKTLDDVKSGMNELKKLIKKDLNVPIISDLLTHLRYLIKHVAFKEEQECRIFKVVNLKENKDIKVADDGKRMYIDYQPMSDHIEAVYFAPKATNKSLFQDLLRHNGLDIRCEQSDHPFF